MPMAFFGERGFSGTRSDLWARFSGEPRLSQKYIAFSRLRFGLKDLTPNPSLSRQNMASTARAKEAPSLLMCSRNMGLLLA